MSNPGIYIIRNKVNGRGYVGKDYRLPKRVNQHLYGKTKGCHAIHAAVQKYGVEAFDVELIPYPGISREALCQVEKWKIKQLGTHFSNGGYNLTWGGEGPVKYQPKHPRRRVKRHRPDMRGENNPIHQMMRDGTAIVFDRRHQQRAGIRSGYARKMKYKIERREFYRQMAVLLYAMEIYVPQTKLF